ncbi:MAG: hypothetical protein IJH91_05070 [Mogibacterium sp.]|nr:hypothetical protein [Mogibacterium sp.]
MKKKTIAVLVLVFTMVFMTACGGGSGSSSGNSIAGNTYVSSSGEIMGEELAGFAGTRSFTFNEDGTYVMVQEAYEYSDAFTLNGEYEQKGSTVLVKADPSHPDAGDATFQIDGDTLVDEGSETYPDENGEDFEVTWKYIYTKAN